MDPIAFQIGSLAIRWYGIFAAAGFLAGYLMLQRRADRLGIGRERGADLAFLAMLGGILGARCLYVAQNWSYFRQHWVEIPRIDHGGLVFYGGFAGAGLAVIGFCRFKSLGILRIADLFAPVLPLGHAFGRLGCLLNGCCFGKPWQGLCSIRYPAASEVASVQQLLGLIPTHAHPPLPVFPVQLLAAVVNLAICAGLLAAEKRLGRPGRLFALYLIAYALTRFLVEFMRGDYVHTFHSLTPAQLVCLGLLPAGIVLFAKAPATHD